jgi:hypothetical protein
MGKKPSQKKVRREAISTKDKGRLVEQIVASMHEFSGVKVQQNVFMPTLGNARRKREIDVLLTSNVAGYLVQIAIECKNKKEVVGSPKIDAFIGKLSDIGIPARHGIYVSASGYSGGAIERASQAGIKPLVLTGLSKDSLSTAVVEAFQSIVYLLPEVLNIHVANGVGNTLNSFQMLMFYDEQGQTCGSIPDLIWQSWLNGQLPLSIGEHDIPITIPAGWHQVIDGKIEPVLSVSAKLRILGLVVTVSGKARQHLLVDASTKKPEKFKVDASFETDKTTFPVTAIQTEEQLKAFVERPGAVKLSIGRIALPRIHIGPMYWPPSERVGQIVIEKMRAFEAGKTSDPRPFNLAEIEGMDMQAIWEPIWGTNSSSQVTGKEGS